MLGMQAGVVRVGCKVLPDFVTGVLPHASSQRLCCRLGGCQLAVAVSLQRLHSASHRAEAHQPGAGLLECLGSPVPTCPPPVRSVLSQVSEGTFLFERNAINRDEVLSGEAPNRSSGPARGRPAAQWCGQQLSSPLHEPEQRVPGRSTSSMRQTKQAAGC